MKIVLKIFIALVCLVIIFVASNYRSYRTSMATARERLAESEILITEAGEIEYSVRGEGVPVLLLHGAGGGFDQGLWLGKLTLGGGYKFISVSRFGYLRSPISEDTSIKSQVGLYKALLDHLNVEKVITVGVSAGGPSATQFANDYPDMVSALILFSAVSGPATAEDQDPLFVEIIHLIQQSDYTYWLTTKYFNESILGLMGVPPVVFESFSPEQKKLAEEMLDVMHPMTLRYPGTVNDERMISNYEVSTGNISAPTLIIHAKDDALVSYEHAVKAERKITGSNLVLFEIGGHGIISKMNDVRKLIDDFFLSVKESN